MQQSVDEVVLASPGLPTRFDTVEAFADAYEDAPGKWELIDGEVARLSPERIGHSLLKTRVGFALELAVRNAGADLLVAIDGPTVKVSARKGRQPDVIVFERSADRRAIVAPRPRLVVEVVSDDSVRVDTVEKLAEYFTVSAIAHYLVVDPDGPLLTWHRRDADGTVQTSVHADGTLAFGDLGIAIDVKSVWLPD